MIGIIIIKKEPGDEANQEVGSSESQATFSYTYTVVTKLWLKIMNERTIIILLRR